MFRAATLASDGQVESTDADNDDETENVMSAAPGALIGCVQYGLINIKRTLQKISLRNVSIRRHRRLQYGFYWKSRQWLLKNRRRGALCFVAAITPLFTGILYVFGIISGVLLHNGFFPREIDLLYSSTALGHYFGIIPGLMHDYHGPTSVAIYGTLVSVAGYVGILGGMSRTLCLPPEQSQGFLAWFNKTLTFAFNGHADPKYCDSNSDPSRPSKFMIILLSFSFCAAAQGVAALHYAVFPSLLVRFSKENRGVVSGVVSACYGISAAVLSFSFTEFFLIQPGKFPLLLAYFGLIGAFVFVAGVSTYAVLPNANSTTKHSKIEASNDIDECDFGQVIEDEVGNTSMMRYEDMTSKISSKASSGTRRILRVLPLHKIMRTRDDDQQPEVLVIPTDHGIEGLSTSADEEEDERSRIQMTATIMSSDVAAHIVSVSPSFSPSVLAPKARSYAGDEERERGEYFTPSQKRHNSVEVIDSNKARHEKLGDLPQILRSQKNRRRTTSAFSDYSKLTKTPDLRRSNDNSVVPPQWKLIVSPTYLSYLAFMFLAQGFCAALIGNIALIRSAIVSELEINWESTHPHLRMLNQLDSFIKAEENVIKEAAVKIAKPIERELLRPTSFFVILVSVGNCFGRLMSGVMSKIFKERGLDYPIFFCGSTLLLCCTQMFLLFAPANWILHGGLSMSLLGIATVIGTNFAIGPVWLLENFNPDLFATLHAIVMGGVAISTSIVSNLFGWEFERVSDRQMLREGSPSKSAVFKCHGSECFVFIEELGVGASVLCFLLALHLVRKSKFSNNTEVLLG